MTSLESKLLDRALNAERLLIRLRTAFMRLDDGGNDPEYVSRIAKGQIVSINKHLDSIER